MIIEKIRRFFGGEPDGVSCRESLRLLQEYMDGELDDLTTAQVEEHFRVCKACYPHLDLEKRFRERLRRASERDCCPDEVRSSVLAAIDEVEGTA